MLLIVAGHSVTHGGFNEIPRTFNGITAIVLTQGARIGVDIFILLSGYFSVKKTVSSRKIKKLYVQVWTYSVPVSYTHLDVYKRQIIGDPFPKQKSINILDVSLGKYHYKNGDRKLVVRTALYKEVAPMPSYENEKNFNPHLMHLQISEKYDFLIYNTVLCVVEYQEDGMSNGIFKQYLNSPKSFAHMRKRCV